MRTLSFILWTTCSVALGIWLATAQVGSRTPWEHAKQVWARSGLKLPALPALPALPSASAPQISERHTDQERDAVNRLVARRGAK
ncbi:MAG TPA: hypothetical protein VND93_16935 [Myxococcales bacterium]|jgi:hypothetical protein|nr:hypothetical protein [Myxococcales bacterium]